MSDQAKTELAPTGVLRAAINMSNFLLVTGRTASGDPDGVSPDMARNIATRLGVGVAFLPYAKPSELADDGGKGIWDIGLIGAEPARAQKIDFTAAYVEIESTYMVPAGSAIQSVAEVDRAGNRIAVSAGSAYDLWLERNIKNATLVRANGAEATLALFLNEKLEAMAGLRPGLTTDILKVPGGRILDGQFSAVQQAIGTAKTNPAGAAFLKAFVEEAKANGLIGSLIEKHGVGGRLTVAPAT